jgi:putative oxidoreductase
LATVALLTGAAPNDWRPHGMTIHDSVIEQNPAEHVGFLRCLPGKVLVMPEKARVSAWSPYVLSVLRLIVALLFIEHGSMKLLGFPPSSGFANVSLFSMEGASGVLELVGGLFLLLGLFTRPVAFILSGEMAFAYFIAHAPKSFFPALNKGELAVVYCFLFLYIAAAGAGPWSLDSVIARGNAKGERAMEPTDEHEAAASTPWRSAA